jgi:hypothetical protein
MLSIIWTDLVITAYIHSASDTISTLSFAHIFQHVRVSKDTVLTLLMWALQLTAANVSQFTIGFLVEGSYF